jgi:hypothetical protein
MKMAHNLNVGINFKIFGSRKVNHIEVAFHSTVWRG